MFDNSMGSLLFDRVIVNSEEGILHLMLFPLSLLPIFQDGAALKHLE